MNKKILILLIAGLCISLAGIMAVQFFWIRNAIRVKEAQFDRSVNDALGGVVEKMETRENMFFISRNFEGDSIMSIVQAFTRDTGAIIRERLDSLLAMNEMPAARYAEAPPPPPPPAPKVRKKPPQGPTGVIRYSYSYSGPIGTQDSLTLSMERAFAEMEAMQPFVFSFNWEDQEAMIDSLMERSRLLSDGFPDPGLKVMTGPQGEIFIDGQGMVIPRHFTDPFGQPGATPRKRQKMQENRRQQQDRDVHIRKLDNKARKIQDVIRQMAIALETKPAPIQQRINKKNLHESIGNSFRDKGIDLPFEFAVYSPSSSGNKYPIRSDGFTAAATTGTHQVALFPNDLFQKPDMLMVFFPDQKSHLLKSMALLLTGSVLFTLIIVMTSAGSIFVMIRQKKISDIKTDFINNMTHEFKTPIATISIAADSINNPRVIAEPDTIRNFTRIIKEENNRMNARVEQVLQMALLDSRDFRLHPVPVDMNTLIGKAAEHYRLQVGKREGTLVTRLEARYPMVLADEDHIRNVLMNLLDNANKYSLESPEIEVYTFNRSGRFFFGVTDRGMGMSQDAQRRVFDKFYRVTSGNIHNIKGFGLGLSYVRAIVLAHRGAIRIESEPGKGSRFEISLPVLPGEDTKLEDHEPKD